MVLKWTKVDDDYELRCPCCITRISIIRKEQYQYIGYITMKLGASEVLKGKTFRAVRALVNKRVEELLNL